MKRFKFKLETVLSERKRIENLRLGEWTLAQRLLQGLIDEKTAFEERLELAFTESTQASGMQRGNVGLIASVDSFIAGTKKRIEWKTGEIERGKKLTERKRLEYVAATQKRKALEQLKEKKHQAYLADARKKETRILDDIYVMNGASRRATETEDQEEERIQEEVVE